MSSARAYAVDGTSQPTSGSKCTVDAMPPSPDGLKTPTGPLLAAQRADGLEEVEPGRRRDDRAGSVGDVVGDLPRLAGPRAADPQRHVLDRAVDRQRADPRHPDRVRRWPGCASDATTDGGQRRPPHVGPAQHRPPGRLPQQHPERGDAGVPPVPASPDLNRRRRGAAARRTTSGAEERCRLRQAPPAARSRCRAQRALPREQRGEPESVSPGDRPAR